jgi:hypothetical protein
MPATSVQEQPSEYAMESTTDTGAVQQIATSAQPARLSVQAGTEQVQRDRSGDRREPADRDRRSAGVRPSAATPRMSIG